MYAPDRVVEKLKQGKVVIGTSSHSASPDLIELYAMAGFDYVFFDMMFTPIDWSEAALLVTAGRAAGITAVPRVQAYPWAKPGGVDTAVLSNIARALGIGATVVWFSTSGVEEARLGLEVGKDYHRKIHLYHFDSMEEHLRKLGGPAIIMPNLETKETATHIDEILALEGLQLLGLALGDLSAVLGHPFQHDHPEVWKFVDKVAEKARARGVALCVNTGYSPDPDFQITRVKKLAEHGIQVILVSQAVHLLQAQSIDMVKRFHDAIPNF